MPTVGTGDNKKHFSYTTAGKKAAAMYGKKTGQPVQMPGKAPAMPTFTMPKKMGRKK